MLYVYFFLSFENVYSLSFKVLVWKNSYKSKIFKNFYKVNQHKKVFGCIKDHIIPTNLAKGACEVVILQLSIQKSYAYAKNTHIHITDLEKKKKRKVLAQNSLVKLSNFLLQTFGGGREVNGGNVTLQIDFLVKKNLQNTYSQTTTPGSQIMRKGNKTRGGPRSSHNREERWDANIPRPSQMKRFYHAFEHTCLRS